MNGRDRIELSIHKRTSSRELQDLQRIVKLVNDESQFLTWNKFQIKAWMQRVGVVFSRYEQEQRFVWLGTDDEEEKKALDTESDMTTVLFINVIARMNSRYEELKAPLTATPHPAREASAASIPDQAMRSWGYFSGDPFLWKGFKTRFETAVHKMQSFTDKEKMTLLSESLKGAAAEAMTKYGSDPSKYQEFWQALNDKYDDNYTLAGHYLTRFFNLGKLSERAREGDLSHLSKETKGLIQKIVEAKYSVENWDLIIVHVLQQRLNDEYTKKWDEFRKNNGNVTIELMTTFLDDQATILRNRTAEVDQIEDAQRSRAASLDSSSVVDVVFKQYKCGVCKAFDHQVYECAVFTKPLYRDRLVTAKQNNLCLNCLKRGHHKKNCRTMPLCDEPACLAKSDLHHRLLCPIKARSECA